MGAATAEAVTAAAAAAAVPATENQNQSADGLTSDNQSKLIKSQTSENETDSDLARGRRERSSDAEYIAHLEEMLRKVVGQNKFLSQTVDDLIDFIDSNVRVPQRESLSKG